MPVSVPDYKSIFESVPGLYLVLLPDLNIAAVSENFLLATMTTKDQLIGRYLFDVFPDNPDDPRTIGVSNFRASLDAILQQGKAHPMTVQRYDIKRQDGSMEERYWSPLIKPVKDERGKLQYIINRVEDVTDFVKMRSDKEKQDKITANLRSQVEEMEAEIFNRGRELQLMNDTLHDQVNKKTAELTDIFDRITDAFIGFDKDDRAIFINKKAVQFVGLSEDELKGKHINEVFAAVYWQPLLKEMYDARIANKKDGLQEVYIEQYKVWLAVDFYPSESGLSVFLRDITSRKDTEAALVKSEEKYRTFIEEAVDAILVYSPATGLYVEVNKKATQLLGYTAEELTALGPSDVTFPENDDLPRFQELEAGKTTVRELMIRRKNGTGVFVESSARKISDGNYLAFMRDISEKKKVELRIKEARDLADKLIDSLPGIFYFYDSTGKFIRWNKQFEEVTGYSGAEIEHMHPTDFFLEEDKNYITARITDVFIKGVNDAEARFITKSGQIIPYYFKAVLINYEGGPCLLGNGIDITERKKSEEELRTSEQKYKLLFESNPLPMWMLNLPNYNIVEVNSAALDQYGFTKEEFLQLDIFSLRPEEDITKIKAVTNKAFRGIYHAGVWRHQKKSGQVIYVEVITHDIYYEGVPTRLVLANEITEKYLSEEKLKKSYESIRQLTAHLQDVREEERTHIAREIHDELGQLLTVLKMDVSWLNKKVGSVSTAVQEKIADILAMIDTTVKAIRRIASELRPSLIDDLGLVAAMEWFIEDFEKRSGIKKEISISGTIADLPDAMKIGIFRIFQESLTNVARHSGGNKVIVRLQQPDKHLILTITDNGKGFDEKKANKKTLGLLGMKERTLMMGGEYNIKGRPGEGTTVTVIIPLADKLVKNTKVYD
jgi:PAS domain S-box-containing protein